MKETQLNRKVNNFSGKARALFRPAGYCAFGISAGMGIYGILVATVVSPALTGSVDERLAFMAAHGGLVASMYILFILMALAEVLVVLGLIALTIKRHFRCAIYGGTFELLNVAVRVVGYMTLITALSGMVSGFISVGGFTFWDDFGYMIEGGGFFLQTLAWGLFGWALKERRGLERAAGVLMLLYAVATFAGGMLRILDFVAIDFPIGLHNLGFILVAPTMGVLSVVILAMLGLVFLGKAKSENTAINEADCI